MYHSNFIHCSFYKVCFIQSPSTYSTIYVIVRYTTKIKNVISICNTFDWPFSIFEYIVCACVYRVIMLKAPMFYRGWLYNLDQHLQGFKWPISKLHKTHVIINVSRPQRYSRLMWTQYWYQYIWCIYIMKKVPTTQYSAFSTNSRYGNLTHKI